MYIYITTAVYAVVKCVLILVCMGVSGARRGAGEPGGRDQENEAGMRP